MKNNFYFQKLPVSSLLLLSLQATYAHADITYDWIGGQSTGNNSGVYGTQGVADASNMPGARNFAVSGSYNPGSESPGFKKNLKSPHCHAGAGSTIQSAVMVFPFDFASNSFDSPSAWQNPFGGVLGTSSTFVRKITCAYSGSDTCVAIGGFHVQCESEDPTYREYGDYGSMVAMTSNHGQSWSTAGIPFESPDEDGHYAQQNHSSVNDIACIGNKCVAVGLRSDDTSDYYTDHPKIAYNLNVKTSPWTAMPDYANPISVDTVFLTDPDNPGRGSQQINNANIMKVYCYDGTHCFALGRVSSTRMPSYYGKAVVLSSQNMTDWTWNERFYPTPGPSVTFRSRLDGISCINANECFAIGQVFYPESEGKTFLMSTSDGGGHWNAPSSADLDQWSIFDELFRGSHPDYEMGAAFSTGISCVSNGTCLATVNYVYRDRNRQYQGNTIQGAVFKRDPSTGQWDLLRTPRPFAPFFTSYTRIQFNDVICYDENVCLISGEQQKYGYDPFDPDYRFLNPVTGFVLHTTDGGANWIMDDTTSIDTYNGYRSRLATVSY